MIKNTLTGATVVIAVVFVFAFMNYSPCTFFGIIGIAGLYIMGKLIETKNGAGE